jgi:hypothetical protein
MAVRAVVIRGYYEFYNLEVHWDDAVGRTPNVARMPVRGPHYWHDRMREKNGDGPCTRER